MVAMLRSVLSRGWTPSLIAAFSAGRPNESKPCGCRTCMPLRRAEARDDVADRVDEHVPHVQRARRVREHLEDVASSEARSAGVGVRDLEGVARRPRRAATSPRSSSRRTAPSSLIRRVDSLAEQKSLSRERPEGNAAAAPRSVPGLRKKLGHEPKTVPGRIRRCSSSSRIRRRSSGGSSSSAACGSSELAKRFGTPLVVYCEETLVRQARALRACGR